MATTGIPSQVEPGTENLTDRLRSALSRLSNQQKILLMIAVAIIAALLVASNTWLKRLSSETPGLKPSKTSAAELTATKAKSRPSSSTSNTATPTAIF